MNNKNFFLLLLGALVVGILNLRLDVMEVDAAQYAEMSWEMLCKQNFLQPTCLGTPYLDKPPLLFWLNTLSFWVFGISNFSYKLPSFLFSIVAVYSTYRFAKLYYEEEVARLAAVMLATSQAVFIMTNDVRTDTMLMGAVIFSIWLWAAFFESSKTKYLLLGSFWVSLALLTKGPIGLIAVSAALIPHLILKRSWTRIFDWRMLGAFFVIAIMLLPMSIGLYQQHGFHGLKFYFWTQSFGRITGESEWNNHPDTFFLVHSTAWQILPWSLFFFGGWFSSIIQLVRMRFVSWSRKEFITISGFTLILISLMLSRYQLPHYVFVVFPLAAVIAAVFFRKVMVEAKGKLFYVIVQSVLLIALIPVALFLQYAFKGMDIFSMTILLFLMIGSVFVFYKTRNWIYVSVAAIVSFNILFSGFYFPRMIDYQHGNDFGRYVHQHAGPQKPFIFYHAINDFSTTFYAQQMPGAELWERDSLTQFLSRQAGALAITGQHGLEELRAGGISHAIIREKLSFRMARLNFKFLNPSTRNEVCDKMYLVELKRP